MVFQRDPGSQRGDFAPEQHHRTHALGGGDALTLAEIIEAPAEGSILVAQSAGPGRFTYQEYAFSPAGSAITRKALIGDQGDTKPTYKETLDATNPTTIVIPNTAAPGTSLIYAHRDHAHGEAAHDVLSAGHGDTLTASLVRGDVLYVNSTPKLARLAKPASPAVLYNDATDAAWDTLAWTTPAFNAGDYTCLTAGTWTVAAGDVTTFKYRLIGKTMLIQFAISTSTVVRSGGSPLGLQILIPAGKTANGFFTNALARVIDNGALTTGFVQANGTLLTCFRTDLAQWAAATDATYVYGSIELETT